MEENNILHCDLNNFFASVEALLNPKLCGFPVAVCGDEADRHGVVLAKNELAKARGVKTAETVREAKRKCPELVTVPASYDKYVYYSQAVRGIFSEFTDRVEPFGMDEAWLDVSGCELIYGVGEEAAHRLRRRIKRETGLTVSVGVSFNKPFAKLGSDLKKPDAVTLISRKNFKEKLWHLPVGAMIGVGASTEKRLAAMGVYTLGQLAACPPEPLEKSLGKAGHALRLAAMGMGDSRVNAEREAEMPKSVSKSVTCRYDITNRAELMRVVLSLCDSVCARLRSLGLTAQCVSVSLKGSDLSVRERQQTLTSPCSLTAQIYSVAASLTDGLWGKEPIRAVGVCASRLESDCDCSQLSIFFDPEKLRREEKLEESIFEIRSRYGSGALKRACLISPMPFGENSTGSSFSKE